MESMEMNKLFSGIYKDKRVLVTGHTGFKGSWLTLWLTKLGAKVSGIALQPNTNPNHWELLNMNIDSNIQDIRDLEGLRSTIKRINPDIIFHLAAQPIVRLSYEEPLETYQTNVMGTINLLEVVREMPSIQAVIIVTSDKCYDNKEWDWGYRENEAMGGKDPYSSSKGCVELVASAYRNSFFSKKHNRTLIATVRAGNVIGGGDWAQDRILTDIVLAATQSRSIMLRNPNATRPWQYVLEPLSGYLALGGKLLESERNFAEAWNFGPMHENNVSVKELVVESSKCWPDVSYLVDGAQHPHEANFLMLDSSKSMKRLKWASVWGFNETVSQTINWYRMYYEEGAVMSEQILEHYINDARNKNLAWSL
jgi:CDP-glucose 4,6-dehydratase